MFSSFFEEEVVKGGEKPLFPSFGGSSSPSRSGAPKARAPTPQMTRPRPKNQQSSFTGSQPAVVTSPDREKEEMGDTPYRTTEEIAELKEEQARALGAFAAIDEKYRQIANQEKREIFYRHVDYLLGLQYVGPTSENVCNHLKQLCSSMLAETEELLEILAKAITREGEKDSDIFPKYDAQGYPLPEKYAPFWRKRDENEKLQKKSFWAMQLMVDERLCGRLIATKLNRFLTSILPSFDASSNANLFHVQKLMSYLLQNGDQEAFRHYCYQPKVMSKMLNVLHYPPVSDFLLQLLLLPPSYDLDEKASLWMHLEIGRFFPTLFEMICDQENPTIASHATDFFQRLIRETYDRVEHIHILFEQILNAELFEKFILSLQKNQKTKVQLTDMTSMLSILLHTASAGTAPSTANVSAASLGTVFAPIAQKFALPVTVNYLQPFQTKLSTALKKHLSILLHCLISDLTESPTSFGPLKLHPHHIHLLEIIYLLMIKKPSTTLPWTRGGSSLNLRGRGRGRGGAGSGVGRGTGGEEEAKKDARSEVDITVMDEVLRSGMWGNVVEWCVTIHHNSFFHKVFFNLFKTIVHTSHQPTLHHLLHDLELVTKLRKSFTKTLQNPSTSHAYVCLYLNMIRLCGDMQYCSGGFNNRSTTDRTVMNYLLSDKEWWVFLPTLMRETEKQTTIHKVKGKRAKKPGIESPGNYNTLFFTPSAPLTPLELPPQFSPGASLGSSFSCSLGFPSPSENRIGVCLPPPSENGEVVGAPVSQFNTSPVILKRGLEGRSSGGGSPRDNLTHSKLSRSGGSIQHNNNNNKSPPPTLNRSLSSKGKSTSPLANFFQPPEGGGGGRAQQDSFDEIPVVQASSLAENAGEEGFDVGKQLGEAMRMVGFGDGEREKEKEQERKRQREREKELERRKYGELEEREKEREEERRQREERERKAREWEEREEKGFFDSAKEEKRKSLVVNEEGGEEKKENEDEEKEENKEEKEEECKEEGQGEEKEELSEESKENEIDRLVLSPPPLSEIHFEE